MDERELLHNSIQCPDGTVLVSRYHHHFVEHTQEDGQEYFVDGGLEYSRVGFSKDDYTDLCIYSDQSHKEIREGFEWGRNFDKDMNRFPETEHIKLKNITDDHLKAIIDLVYEGKIMKVLTDELKYRKLL